MPSATAATMRMFFFIQASMLWRQPWGSRGAQGVARPPGHGKGGWAQGGGGGSHLLVDGSGAGVDVAGGGVDAAAGPGHRVVDLEPLDGEPVGVVVGSAATELPGGGTSGSRTPDTHVPPPPTPKAALLLTSLWSSSTASVKGLSSPYLRMASHSPSSSTERTWGGQGGSERSGGLQHPAGSAPPSPHASPPCP